MSFILDALKKSEQERERQQTPQPLDIPYGQRNRRQPWWLLIVIGLLLVNCVLLFIMWWRSSIAPPSGAGNQTSSSVSNSASSMNAATPAIAPSITPAITSPRTTEVRPLQGEAGAEMEMAEEAAATEPEPAPPLVRSVPAEARSNVASNTAGDAPTLASLGGSGALNLPELRIDVHVYSTMPADRFVFINSRKYTQGQTLSEGPQLERITPEGVILTYRNQRFLLPR